MTKRKKAPSVKIPSSVLKREAQKMAKQIIKKEEQKERQRVLREKAKVKAQSKVARAKERQGEWDDYFHNDRIREVWGVGWCFLSVILGSLFISLESGAVQVTMFFKSIFGLGIWLIPLLCAALGIILIFFKEIRFPQQRVMALFGVFFFFIGLVHLMVPLSESHALGYRYGGNIGFSMGYFPRVILGDLATFFIFMGGFFVCAWIGFGIQVNAFLAWVKQQYQSPNALVSVGAKAKKASSAVAVEKSAPVKAVASKPEAAKRFKNELEIIDSTKTDKPKNAAPINVKLKANQEDEMDENIQKTFGEWEPPEVDLLKENHSTIAVDEKELRNKADAICEKLEQFGIMVEMRSVHVGPTVTQFTLEPSAGVKLTKITALKDDLSLALAAPSLRIEAPIPGKKLVGIEIPNEQRAIVSMREILESEPWEDKKSDLSLALGRDVAGKPIVVDLAKMPHLLIAGKTGSGKSVAMNAFLVSLLWNNSPADLRLILIDPKRVELKPYDHLPHLLTPVIVEPEKSVSALAWAVAEMNRRYRKLSEHGVRNLAELNEKDPESKEPFIVIVIDELADLMMVAGKDVEAAICRLAQMARAVGMHLIVATQRPSVDVVTGLIKANLPARVAFRVNTGIDSRTIIDGVGAEDLLGFGDMLYLDGNSGSLTRIQGLLIEISEVDRVTNHIKIQFPEMIANDEITNQSIEGMAKGRVLTAGTTHHPMTDEDLDAKFEEAVSLVMETGKASASFLQRRLEVGYARAARILDQMEAKGIIGQSRGAKPREIFGRQETNLDSDV